MSIRSIIFDLGGVLLIDRPAESIRRFDRLGFVEARGLHVLPSGESLECYVERCYASHLLHIKKPDPRFYHLILDENHLDPRETLYIDDREENVTAARVLGLTTLRPANGTDWRPALERLLSHE